MTSVRPALASVADPPADPYQVPPTTADERAVIGAAILANDDIRAVMLGSYRPTDLTDPKCRFVDSLLRQMQEAAVPVDELTVVQFARRQGLANGTIAATLASWLAETVGLAPVPASGTWYAAAVVETSSRRSIREAAGEIVRVADEASIDDLETVIDDRCGVMRTAITRAKVAAA